MNENTNDLCFIVASPFQSERTEWKRWPQNPHAAHKVKSILHFIVDDKMVISSVDSA